MESEPVLIVGAGPTGLTLALWLARLGIRVRIVDKAAEPGTTSRALVLHARTLEFYRQLGFADGVVDRAQAFLAANLWVAGTKVAHLEFGDIGAGVTPFPRMLILPQDEHERLLIEHLAAAGVEVERRTELVGFEDLGERVRARLRRPDGGEETCEPSYLAGCDGGRSTVRETLGIGFPGGTYGHLFYVADVEARGPVMNGELHVALDEADFLGAFPMKGSGRARLIGTIEEDAERGHAALGWDDVSHGIMERLGIDVQRVNWFSTYHVYHRVASHFRKQRVFLLGDAAHIHSPVGGQGMNTGIGDAANLAWKLAAVLESRAAADVLDTYEPERIAFARRLVATTDTAFSLVTSPGRTARVVRVRIVPRVLPPLVALRAVRRLMFRTISQTRVRYRASALSAGRAGRVHGGDRLPWVPGERAENRDDNFTPLASLDWQVHVYGEPGPTLLEVCRARGLTLHVFPWRNAMRRAGLARNAVYLVRPDGYVGLADRRAMAVTLERYLDAHGIAPRPGLRDRAQAA
jgi:2-polyprenyl-6-methoxyphenol hydroxylase-like FAD-dependent oxidoreductase